MWLLLPSVQFGNAWRIKSSTSFLDCCKNLTCQNACNNFSMLQTALLMRRTYITAGIMQSGVCLHMLVLKRHVTMVSPVIFSHSFLVCRCSMRGCHVTRRQGHVEPHVAKCCHVGATTARKGVMQGPAQPSAGQWWISPAPVAEPTRCYLAMNPSGVHHTEYNLSDLVAQLASMPCHKTMR